MFTSAEEATAPACGVCGRKLAIGFHFTCHVCGVSYCYAHAPVKCAHKPAKVQPARVRISR